MRSALRATPLDRAARDRITTLRSVTSTRCLLTTTNIALRLASLPCLGAVPSTIPPVGGIPRTTGHGTLACKSTGVSEINGAVTLLSWPCCGQFSCAVVCTTGSRGVAIDSTNPISPAMVATQRVTLTLPPASWVAVMFSGCAVCVLTAVLESVLVGSSRTWWLRLAGWRRSARCPGHTTGGTAPPAPSPDTSRR